MAVELARRRLPLAVGLDEGLERAHELAAVVALALLDRPEQRLAEQRQRVGVLEREQQLEGAEVAVGRQALGRLAVAQRLCLERAARLVEGAARLGRRDRPAGAGAHALAEAQPDALAELKELLVGEAGQQRARELARARDQPAGGLVAQGLLELPVVAGRHQRRDAGAEAEGLEAAREVGALELAGADLREHGARHAALRRVA